MGDGRSMDGDEGWSQWLNWCASNVEVGRSCFVDRMRGKGFLLAQSLSMS